MVSQVFLVHLDLMSNNPSFEVLLHFSGNPVGQELSTNPQITRTSFPKSRAQNMSARGKPKVRCMPLPTSGVRLSESSYYCDVRVKAGSHGELAGGANKETKSVVSPSFCGGDDMYVFLSVTRTGFSGKSARSELDPRFFGARRSAGPGLL